MPKTGMEPMRRRALIDAAIAAIGARGSLDVTMSDIASRAGVSSALAHHYFGAKEGLLQATMRQILIDEIRRMRAAKRQAPPVSTQLPPELGAQSIDLEDLDRALAKLETVAPDHARLVEQRYFAGLTLEEVADIDGVSVATVKRQWRAARAWLVAELGQR